MKKAFSNLQLEFLAVATLAFLILFTAFPHDAMAEATPSITILSPKAGDIWVEGTEQTIRWTSTAVPSNAFTTIGLIYFSGRVNSLVWNVETTNSGSYRFTVPSGLPEGSSDYIFFIQVLMSGGAPISYVSPLTVTRQKVDLSALPLAVPFGGSARLSWSSNLMDSCSATAAPADPNWAGSKGTSGSQNVSPASRTVYTLSCTGPYGAKTASVSVGVTVVSAVAVSNVTSSEATITWATSELADSQVEYGTSSSLGQATAVDTRKVTNHLMTLMSLRAGITYFYRVKSTDGAGNIVTSAIQSFVTPIPPSGDVNPPDAITDLRITSGAQGESSIVLTWTAPREDQAPGAASAYDLRYAASPITDGSWANATKVTGLPAPAPAGTTQNFTLAGLALPNTYLSQITYWVAIQSRDGSGNASLLSNTVKHPVVQRQPDGSYPTVTVTSPKAGDIWVKGSRQTVQWTTTSYSSSQQMVINLIRPGASPISLADSANILNSGSAEVTVPSSPTDSSDYQIIVSNFFSYRSHTPYTSGGLSDYFTITSGSVTLTPPVPTPPSPPPTLTLAASPSSITSGQSSTLTWSSTNATSCTASNGWSGSKSTSGSQSVSPTSNTMYTFSCTGSGGSASKSATITVTPGPLTGIIFRPDLEGRTDFTGITFTIKIYTPGNSTPLATFSGTGGNISLPPAVSLNPGNFDLTLEAPYYLRKRLANTALSSGSSLNLPKLPAGDLNQDGVINSLDWSVMSPNWFTNSQTSDINRDGVVNSIDFSLLNRNWGRGGE